jgi:hypothetical protein
MNKISSKKIWVVGDRIITPSNQRGLVTSADKKIGITWENGLSDEYTPKQIQAYGYQEFLEEEGAIASCNLNTPVSLQELEALTSELMPPEHQTSSKQNSLLKITTTRNSSSVTDFPISPSTATSETTTQSRENSTSTQLDFLAQGHQSLGTEPDLNTQNQNSGLKPCGVLPTAAPTSSSLKILQDLSTEDYEQFLGDSEWLATSGTIRKSYQLRNSDRPKKGKGFSSLPTPTTYAKGSTGCRPAGATRLEQKLRPYITKGDKLNPAVPGWMMGFPVGWVERVLMDTGETISVQLPLIPEYATTSTSGEIVTTSTPDQSALSKQQLQLSESVTSPTLQQIKQSDIELNLYICNSSLNIGKIIEVSQTCFTVDWNGEIKCYFWERDNEIINGLAIAPQHLITKFFSQKEMLKAIEDKSNIERTQQLQIDDRIRILKTHTQSLSQWVGHIATVTGINSEAISVAVGEGREKKHLTLQNGWYEVILENFLEEKDKAPASVQQPKPSKQKGCLYKYYENKKLKDGTIATYPRVIGDRNPDNPHHWRWGFNWEKKIDDEWKGRSINSIPVGAIPLIQSMRNERVPLEEIIGFIKRAKAKK